MSEYKPQVPTAPVTSAISPIMFNANTPMSTIPSTIRTTRSIMPTFFSPIFNIFTLKD